MVSDLFRRNNILGNVRAVYNQFIDRVVQQTDYYPYGLPKATSTNPSANRFKYSGKELETDLHLIHYDFEARMQLPTLGLFQRPDPKAGDYPWLNSYTYCGGDPINNIYPCGEFIDVIWDAANVIYDVGAAVNSHINEKENVKGNRTKPDQLIRNSDGSYTYVETKLTGSTNLTKGQ